jgi:hypothetical protein
MAMDKIIKTTEETEAGFIVDGKLLSEIQFRNLQERFPHVQWIICKMVDVAEYKYRSREEL